MHSCTVQSRVGDGKQKLHGVLCQKYYLALKDQDIKAQDPGTRVVSRNTERKHEQSPKAVRRSII